ncbi:TrkH family potassium uptake protein [Breznakiella homolactica]|uniref:Trk system potassium uptake protein TrkH n=1 Tax=Breznakiella homolactica TaxID=2798577 RepID=A0A7T8BB12_9SPIR|nr:potassium transporter TrkG [Breznakiella homolactica]QQO10067.1 Trk family potassium uptake protein [Breznakiella homolactica]
MNIFQRSDAFYLLIFFLILISAGTALLLIPGAWKGYPDTPDSLTLVDALFTATSAVCVTGLSTVNTAGFSRLGHIIIMLLIQLGGLGIISFTSILLSIPGNRLPFRRLNTIRAFYIDGVEYNPRRIVRNIVIITFLIEFLGAVLLSFFFYSGGTEDWLFAGIFHAVSSFCNAGFSPFAANLVDFAYYPPVLIVVMLLIITGGLGFIVLNDISRRVSGKRKHLSYHSRVVLGMTGLLLAGGTLFFLMSEWDRAFRDMEFPVALVNALFQAVTPRTAGFEAVPQAALSQPSQMLTGLLMLIGGAPGSIAGGLKVTTVFVVLMVMFRRPDKNGDIKVSHHRLAAGTINNAVVYFLKALALLLICTAALSVVEGLQGDSFGAIVFEVLSAFGTVGLTVGMTPDLTVPGKLVIIGAMFAGRVGLIALAFPAARHRSYDITYPEGTVLLG